MPFGDTVWRHAHAQARESGVHKAREAEIAAIADDLLDRAAQGPVDRPKAERRLTGRTTAALKGPQWPRPADEPDQLASEVYAEPADTGTDEDVAEVIPLPVFDARKEAQSWRL